LSVLHYSEVGGLRMAYREAGSGPPIVFLHGNPTSSFLRRNIIGPLAHHGRCLAPDLVGMGASDPLPDSGPDRYRFLDDREHLDALLTTIGADREVVVVGHDWGGVLGIDWARHPDAVRGIAYMETLVAPVSWNSENAPDPTSSAPCAPTRANRWSCTTDPPGPTANRWHRQRREVAGLLTDLEDLRGRADDQRIVVRDHRGSRRDFGPYPRTPGCVTVVVEGRGDQRGVR
jgi:pimeloyl-ACP methyl ester carboxylesterase